MSADDIVARLRQSAYGYTASGHRSLAAEITEAADTIEQMHGLLAALYAGPQVGNAVYEGARLDTGRLLRNHMSPHYFARAIEAAVIERCATVAETYIVDSPSLDAISCGKTLAARTIADAIRSWTVE